MNRPRKIRPARLPITIPAISDEPIPSDVDALWSSPEPDPELEPSTPPLGNTEDPTPSVTMDEKPLWSVVYGKSGDESSWVVISDMVDSPEITCRVVSPLLVRLVRDGVAMGSSLFERVEVGAGTVLVNVKLSPWVDRVGVESGVLLARVLSGSAAELALLVLAPGQGWYRV